MSDLTARDALDTTDQLRVLARNALTRLKQARADAPHEDDARSHNEQRACWLTGQQLGKAIPQLESAISAQAEADAALPALEEWHDGFLVPARQHLCDELLAVGSRSPKTRGLELSIQQIDRGLPFHSEMLPARLPLDDLLSAAGYATGGTVVSTCGKGWRGCLPEVERRIAQLRKQREGAEQQIEAALRFAGTLLNETTS